MKKLILFTLCILFCSGHSFADRFHNQKVIGYIPDYGDASQVDYNNLTHAIFCFLFASPDGGLIDQSPGSITQLQHYLSATAASGSKRLVALSGLYNMSTVTENPTKRVKLCDTLVSYCLHHGFDGLDLDWEGLGSTQDSINFKNFVADLAPRLAAEDLTFVITIGFGDWSGKWFPDVALRQADWLQIMAYDAAGTWATSPMDNHSSLQHFIDADTYWTNRGYPRNKMVMGLPFYGYQFSSNNGGIGQPKTYREIVETYPNLIDMDNRTPGNDRTCFNGPELIRRKCQYLIDSSFAGVFVWEMTQDATGDQSLHKQIICTYEETNCIRKNPPSCITPNLNDGLVSRWYFSENTLDVTQQRYHGTALGGSYSTDRFGNANNAYLFHENTRIDIEHPMSLHDFTLSAWIKLSETDYTGIQPIIQQHDAYPGPFAFYVEHNQLHFYSYKSNVNTSLMLSSIQRLATEQWYHVVVTHSTSYGSRLYINGVLENEGLDPSPIYQAPEQKIRIGASNGFGFQFHGNIDDVSIYDKAINLCTVDSAYRMPYQGMSTTNTRAEEELNVRIYPNPSHGILTISLDKIPLKAIKMVLSNAIGEPIEERNIQEQHILLKKELAPGMYYLNFFGEHKMSTQKIVIQ